MFIVSVLIVIVMIALAVAAVGLRRRSDFAEGLSKKDREAFYAAEGRNTEAAYTAFSAQGFQRLG